MDLFDPLFVGLLGSGFLLGELAEAFFHRCDLVVHALVVAVLGSERVQLGLDVGKQLLLLLGFEGGAGYPSGHLLKLFIENGHEFGVDAAH